MITRHRTEGGYAQQKSSLAYLKQKTAKISKFTPTSAPNTTPTTTSSETSNPPTPLCCTNHNSYPIFLVVLLVLYPYFVCCGANSFSTSSNVEHIRALFSLLKVTH